MGKEQLTDYIARQTAEARARRMSAGLNPSTHEPHCPLSHPINEHERSTGACRECFCDDEDVKIAHNYGATFGPGGSLRRSQIGAGFYPSIPKITEVPAPKNDTEADDWIAATIQALDKRALERLYRILYNEGYRVNR